MKYLSENEREARLWVEGKKFSPSFLRKHVSYGSNSMYQRMSEFIHSNFKGTLAFTIVEDGRMKATIGEYDKEQLESVLLLTLLTMETTIIWLSLKFAQDIKITRKALLS